MQPSIYQNYRATLINGNPFANDGIHDFPFTKRMSSGKYSLLMTDSSRQPQRHVHLRRVEPGHGDQGSARRHSYEYDAVGNRRRVWSYYHDGIAGAAQTQKS